MGHAFEGYYRATAREMIRSMAQVIASERGQYGAEEWDVAVGNYKMAVTPDRVVLVPDGRVHVQRIRTGRETKSEADRPIYALLRAGAAARYRGRHISIETYYLASGKQVVVEPKNDGKKIQSYLDAIATIENGEFEPDPNPRDCPNCQCYFTCKG